MYSIIEVANTHGGDINYLYSLLEEFEEFTEDVGIKFQPFKYDEIALADFEWYPVYEKLFFNETQWAEIISKASKTKDVWLDLFDLYGVKILRNNLSAITGIKLQTSVLNNYSVLKSIKNLNLKDKKLIINVAGRDIENIQNHLRNFEEKYIFKEVLLEVGFQAYPTELIDSGISKLKTVKERFNKKIVFADHVEGKGIDAKLLPVLAVVCGADVIEKHVQHSSLEAEYDHYSSIKVDDFRELIGLLDSYSNLMDQPFINQNEINYYENTMQIPVLSEDVEEGTVISLNNLDYKRTSSQGCNYVELKNLIGNGYIQMVNGKEKSSLIQKGDLKKVKIACIIAARMKSSRLKQKATLKIGDLSSLQLCIKNCLRFEHVDATILATSHLEEDAQLKDHLYDPSVIFHTGDPEDVIQRYLDIIHKEKIDVFIRVTGDMPYVSKEIAAFLLEDHFLSGADYTVGETAAVGTNLEIINSSALEKVKSYFPKADYSEYMTWYFQNNPDYFKLNYVSLPSKWVRDYRLTLDYKEDLDMLNTIANYFNQHRIEFSLDTLFDFMDLNQEVSKMNEHLSLRYKTDKSLIEKLDKFTKIPKK